MNTAQPSTSVYALLADGSTAEIRPAAAGDFEAVREMHRAMSPDNLYLRFFSMSPAAADQEASRICRAPAADHATLLAWLSGELVGVASYECEGTSGTAEFAVAVADHVHHRGVATLLLEHLVSAARDQGIRTFTAEVLAENSEMLKVFADAGLHARRRWADGVAEMAFDLPGDTADPGWEPYLDAVADREGRADVASLRPLFAPGSVAVVGASRHPGGVGRVILHNIMTGGYAGQVWAVNPQAHHLEGAPCVPSPAALPVPVDLAVLAIPAQAVVSVAEQCGERGVRSLVVITAGLDSGTKAALLACCRRYGMRMIGPNCFGVAVPGIALDATFGAQSPHRRDGGPGGAVRWCRHRPGRAAVPAGHRHFLVRVAGRQVRRVRERPPHLVGSGSRHQARRAVPGVLRQPAQVRPHRPSRRSAHMPVLTVEAGRSEAGQRAAASHTAAAATPLVTREALFAQAGIVATRDIGELLDTAALLASQPVPAGSRVAIVSNAGGAGVLAADACADAGLHVAVLDSGVQDSLRQMLPPGAEVTGPVDTTATVTSEAFRRCLEHVAADDGVDAILALAVPTAVADLVPAASSARVSKPARAGAAGSGRGRAAAARPAR